MGDQRFFITMLVAFFPFLLYYCIAIQPLKAANVPNKSVVKYDRAIKYMYT